MTRYRNPLLLSIILNSYLSDDEITIKRVVHYCIQLVSWDASSEIMTQEGTRVKTNIRVSR